MARSNDIQYIRYYSPGSAAEKVELPRLPKKQPKPKAAPVPKKAVPVVRIDGLAAIGIVVAAVMLLCMLMGCAQVYSLNRQVLELKEYVSYLELQQDSLEADYAHGYDLEDIRSAALSMGLVPKDQVEHITVHIPETETVVEISWWDSLLNSIREFFA